MKILLIDDSRLLRHIQERALIRAGYEVLSAKDGDEGLRIAREDSPSLILLDMMLPKIAGQDVLRTLKHDHRTKHIPVVVLSSLPEGNAPKLLDQGAVQFLEKTKDLLESNSQGLVKALERVLSKANNLNEIAWH